MRYKVTIDTSSFKKLRCSQKNWERGTINDFMAAINGWTIIEPDIQCLKWRLAMFSKSAVSDNWDNFTNYYTEKYIKWKNQCKNKITFKDVLCNMTRVESLAVYGFAQGYFNIDAILDALEKNGSVKVPFSRAYDSRQYLKNYDKCFILIEKIPKKVGYEKIH